MDFDRLPSEILFTVLLRLPFKERIRIACVNRRFKDVSEMVISHTMALCLTAPIFRNANAKSMSKLFHLCAPNLKELICDVPHVTRVKYRSMMLNRLRIISKIPHPRLEVLKIDSRCFNDAKAFRKLLSRLPNLCTLEWMEPPSGFPKTVCENLECVTLRQVSIDFVASLADYCPNVKHVFLDGFPYDDQKEHGLNGALAKLPTLETLLLRRPFGTMKLENIDSLWRLGSLRTLHLGCGCSVTDQVIEKVSAVFPQLESLGIHLGQNLTSQGFAVLKNLKHLRQISLADWGGGKIDAFATEMINFECLETVELDASYVSPGVMVALAHCCPKLRWLQVQNIRAVYSQSEVKSFVQSLDGFVQQDLSINLTRADRGVWQCAEVQSVVAQIQILTNRQLSITVGNDYPARTTWGMINEWERDLESHFEDREKSFRQRLIDTMRNLPSKLFNIFK